MNLRGLAWAAWFTVLGLGTLGAAASSGLSAGIVPVLLLVVSGVAYVLLEARRGYEDVAE